MGYTLLVGQRPIEARWRHQTKQSAGRSQGLKQIAGGSYEQAKRSEVLSGPQHITIASQKDVNTGENGLPH
jgi:hypothetical protein